MIDQTALGNKYEMEVTRSVLLHGRGSKLLMEGYNKKLDKK